MKERSSRRPREALSSNSISLQSNQQCLLRDDVLTTMLYFYNLPPHEKDLFMTVLRSGADSH
jgi:hypothetical protein